MAANGLPGTLCPNCQSPYTVDLEGGLRFCPECRHEWNPRDVPAPVEAPVLNLPDRETNPVVEADLDLSDKFSTVVEVEHDDGGSGNWRTDRFTWVTNEPHTAAQAEIEATDHFLHEVGSGVRSARATFRFPDVEPLTTADIDADLVQEHLAAPDESEALAEAYLESLVGTGVTLEGGQRAVLLGFPDVDHAEIQLMDGSVVVVDFDTIIGADTPPAEGVIVETEIDDATAEMFGSASLALAYLVIEAGVASIEGEGDNAHLVESPTGWFPPDEDAIPLMEMASAAAVAMLIQTFALPRDELLAMVTFQREKLTQATTTEAQGNGTDTDTDHEPDDAGEPGGAA